MEKIVYRGKIFSKKKNKLYVFRAFGKTFNLMHYPLSFYYIFAKNIYLQEEFKRSIAKRNDVLQSYKQFCINWADGNVFYLPWWIRFEENSPNHIKKFLLEIVKFV
jgi:hypothetical protein